ncbi:MAG: hypothetical protein WAU86_05320, partial [Oricola sp.]
MAICFARSLGVAHEGGWTMTDDLRHGDEITGAQGSGPGEQLTSMSAAETAVGQAGEAIVVNRPAPGQTVEIQAAAGQTYVLNFAPGAAQVQVQGDNFVLAFDDNGDGTPDSQIVFLDLVDVVEGAGEAPTFQIAGVDIGSDVLLGQALALAGQGEAPLDEVAAGPGAQGGGATAYDDNLGDILDLLVAQGVIPPVNLEFGLINVEADPIILEENVDVPLLINEIGVGVAMTIPSLPGEDGGDGGPYGEVFAAIEEEQLEYNFIELVNTSDSALDTDDLTIEILNPAGEVVTFSVPNGITIPAGGFIVFYQLANDGDESLTEDIVIRVFDAQGNVVGGFTIDEAGFWNLGDDTTDPIAVNVVFDGDESVDTFAANVEQEDLAGLTDPDFIGTPNLDGAPEGFGSPLLNLNFDTFNGQFTGNHHIFSRVDLDDTDSQNDWTTNNTPTDGTLNDLGPSGYSFNQDGDLVRIDLETGEVDVVGQLTWNGDSSWTDGVDVDGLAFGSGDEAGFLFAYSDGFQEIYKIDPQTAEVVEYWEIDEDGALNDTGFTIAVDGTFYVISPEDGLFEVQFNNDNTFNLALVTSATAVGASNFYLSSLAADLTNPDILYALGDGENVEDGQVKLFIINVDTGTVTELPGIIPVADTDTEFGLEFDAYGRLWAIDEGNGIAFRVDPATGAAIAGSTISIENFEAFESIAIQHIIDRNPWDPLNDDLNPQQNNPDPLAGQNFLQAEAGGDLVEGYGGPDFILGAGGNDSLYGGSEELYVAQAEKMVGHAMEMQYALDNLFYD